MQGALGWVCTPRHLGEEHDSTAPALGWQCHGAFDTLWEPVTHPYLCFQCVLQVVIPWWDTVGRGGRQQEWEILSFLATFSFCTWAPQLCIRPNVLQQLSAFNLSRS